MTPTDDIPYQGWLMALLSLPSMGPNRVAQLLENDSADEVWRKLCDGRPVHADQVRAETVGQWRTAARAFDVADRWHALTALGIGIDELGGVTFPDTLNDDIEPPAILFRLGVPIGPRPAVAIVGTRTCTSYGRRVAFELGASLADAEVSVVSGLALGIDAAAHQGALSVPDAQPVGVVGSGLDVIYPKRNAKLWHTVAARGTLLSEAPPGANPERWRFPARNRIIAGIADAVVVVESHAKGGSLLTVDEAQLRDVPVGAVPGPITSSSSVGSNQLLADGAVPVLGVDDVLAMIGHMPPKLSRDSVDALSAAVAADEKTSLVDAMGWSPVLFEQLCLLVSWSPAQIAAEVERLVGSGRCVRSGPWIERVK